MLFVLGSANTFMLYLHAILQKGKGMFDKLKNHINLSKVSH